MVYSFDELPPDITCDIISRNTTLSTLDTCKMVSKEWNEMIHDSSFLSLYIERSGNLFGYFVQYMRRNKWISKFVPNDELQRGGGKCLIDKSWARNDDTKVLASCDQGIVCCQKCFKTMYRWYMCKPATKQWKVMPNPKLRFITVGVAVVVFKSQPLHYKVVRLSNGSKIEESMMKYYCEIFDSKTWTWREAQGVDLHYEESIKSRVAPISIGEFVYWQTDRDNVLEFDIHQQHFKKKSLPVCHNYNKMKTKKMDSITTFPDGEFHVLDTFKFRSDLEYVVLRGG